MADFGIALAASKAGGSADDRDRHVARHAALHVARAGDGRARDHRPLRRLRARRGALRDAHRRSAVHRLDRAGDRGAGGDRDAAAAPAAAPHHSRATSRRRRSPRSRSCRPTGSPRRPSSPRRCATSRTRRPCPCRPPGPARRARRAHACAPGWPGVLVPVLALALGLAAGGGALWARLRPAPAPLLSQFSLALKPSQALQPPSPSGGARIALSRRRPRAGVHRARRVGHPPLAPAHRPARRDADRRAPRAPRNPFFSPDGSRVGFIKNGTEVRIASLAGAPTVTLTDKANTTSGDWGDDGYIYFEVDSGVARMRATGGEIEPVYKIQHQGQGDRDRVGARPARRHRRPVPAAPRGPGPGRLRDHGDAAAARPRARRWSAACSRPTPTGHLLVVTVGRQADRHPVRPEEARDSPARRSRCSRAIGVRNDGFNIDLVARPGTARWPIPPAARRPPGAPRGSAARGS